MERAEVVVRRSGPSTEPARVGTVLSADGNRCRVRWDETGEEEDVVVGGITRRARRGSLRHQALVDPSPIGGWFAEDPKGMVLRLLREQGSAMSPRRIREELEQLGLDAAAVNKAWTAASKALSKNDDVEVSGKKNAPQYRWIGPEDEPAEAATAEGPAREAVPKPVPEIDPVELIRPAEPATLVGRISAVIGDESSPLNDYISRPLWVGARFGQLESQRIDAFLAALDEQDRALMENLLIALPRQSATIEGSRRLAQLDGIVVTEVLTVAANEIRAYQEPEPGVLAAASWLLRRAAAIADLPSPAAAPIVVLICWVGMAHRDQDVPVLEAAADALGRLLPGLPRDERAGLDLTGLAEAVAHLPLRRDGGRATLVAAIGKLRSKSLLSAKWWEGVTLDALAEGALGVLGGVTSRPDIIEQYIDPLMARELSLVTSRTRLSFLLGLPGEFVEHLRPEAVAAAFRRVAGGEQIVAGWVDALAQEQRVEALRRDVERAQAGVADAEQRAEAAELRVATLAERCERLEETLRAEHVQASSLRSAQDRQIQIDVIRSLADLAAEVEELAVEQAGPEVLVERVRALVSAQALEPVGRTGQNLPFSPTAHEPIVGNPREGTDVTVIRPGYRWRPIGDDILIEKALVTMT